jgi:hypothetical protein
MQTKSKTQKVSLLTFLVPMLLVALCAAPTAIAGVPFTFSRTGDLTTARAYHTATLLPSGKVLVTGGDKLVEGGDIEDFWETAELYDPATGIWTPTGSMMEKRAYHTATLLPSGKVLVVGGYNGTLNGGSNFLGSAELYDPATGHWSPVPGSLATARWNHTATLLANGKVLVAGGGGGDGAALASAELYDPATGYWTPTTNMLTVPRQYHTAAVLPNGKVLVAGGSGDTSTELYDPATGLWAATGSMSVASYGPTMTLLPNGKLLAVGGTTATYRSNAELYDQGTGTWLVTASASLHSSPTATLLPNGQVLLAGYFPELYDPASGTWALTSGPVGERWSHTATLLPDGQVLIAAGLGYDFDIQPVSLTTAELFDSGSTPQARTGIIISQVQGLVTAGALNSSQGAALTTKLDNVVSKLSKGQKGAAGNQLGAFSNQVGAFINSGSLTLAQGQPLIDAAAAIRSQIGS